MIIIEQSAVEPSRLYVVNGVFYRKGIHNIFYDNVILNTGGTVDESVIRVGVRSSSRPNSNQIYYENIISPSPVSSFTNGDGMVYTSLADLLSDLAGLVDSGDSTPAPNPFLEGLVYNFDFKDNTDNSVGPNNGVATNSPIYIDGVIDRAINFNTIVPEQYVAVADADDLSFTDGTSDIPFSMSFWIRPQNLTDTQFIIWKGGSTSEREYRVSMHSTGLRFQIMNATTSFLTLTIPSNLFTINKWSHVVWTYDGSATAAGLTAYMMGVESGSVVETGTYTGMTNSGQDLGIGTRLDSPPNNNFVGQCDLFKIYRDRELTSSEASTIFNRESTGQVVIPQSNPTPNVYGDLNIVFDGNSLTRSQHENGVEQYISTSIENHFRPICNTLDVTSLGVGSQQIQTMIANYPSNVASLYDPSKINVLVFNEDASSLGNGGITGQQNLDFYDDYLQLANATGWDVIIPWNRWRRRTPYPGTSTPASRQRFEDWLTLVNGGSGLSNPFTDFIDMITLPNVGGPADQAQDSYFFDNIHLNIIGNDEVVERMIDVLESNIPTS